jgi:peptide/nickel transport system permease protein
MTARRVDSGAGGGGARRSRTLLVAGFRNAVRRPLGAVGFTILMLFIIAAIAAPLLAPHDPLFQYRGNELEGPSAQFLLGTDERGRDILSRIIYGTRISLLVGVIAVSLGATIGTATGLVAGYYGGATDSALMRLWDVVFAVPTILLGITIAAVFGASATNAAVTLGIASMPLFARIARSVAIRERAKEYVGAALTDGIGRGRVLFRHILPNATGPLLVQLALAMAYAILVESALSFIGLGTQPPTPSWGRMLAESRQFMHISTSYVVAPGVAISLLVIGLNFLADALRDGFDPKTR